MRTQWINFFGQSFARESRLVWMSPEKPADAPVKPADAPQIPDKEVKPKDKADDVADKGKDAANKMSDEEKNKAVKTNIDLVKTCLPNNLKDIFDQTVKQIPPLELFPRIEAITKVVTSTSQEDLKVLSGVAAAMLARGAPIKPEAFLNPKIILAQLNTGNNLNYLKQLNQKAPEVVTQFFSKLDEAYKTTNMPGAPNAGPNPGDSGPESEGKQAIDTVKKQVAILMNPDVNIPIEDKIAAGIQAFAAVMQILHNIWSNPNFFKKGAPGASPDAAKDPNSPDAKKNGKDKKTEYSATGPEKWKQLRDEAKKLPNNNSGSMKQLRENKDADLIKKNETINEYSKKIGDAKGQLMTKEEDVKKLQIQKEDKDEKNKPKDDQMTKAEKAVTEAKAEVEKVEKDNTNAEKEKKDLKEDLKAIDAIHGAMKDGEKIGNDAIVAVKDGLGMAKHTETDVLISILDSIKIEPDETLYELKTGISEAGRAGLLLLGQDTNPKLEKISDFGIETTSGHIIDAKKFSDALDAIGKNIVKPGEEKDEKKILERKTNQAAFFIKMALEKIDVAEGKPDTQFKRANDVLATIGKDKREAVEKDIGEILQKKDGGHTLNEPFTGTNSVDYDLKIAVEKDGLKLETKKVVAQT